MKKAEVNYWKVCRRIFTRRSAASLCSCLLHTVQNDFRRHREEDCKSWDLRDAQDERVDQLTTCTSS